MGRAVEGPPSGLPASMLVSTKHEWGVPAHRDAKADDEGRSEEHPHEQEEDEDVPPAVRQCGEAAGGQRT